ncbi:uncharacterized protein CTRU02_208516 [Colletotrichum truncatum]|uniref:Uncharacterized protein n=1 Tax=Colletotrichum truncatum TaxID=5467 RepID=A0ACC3YWI9_COLTU|nr:uncharacterized protein CTRU02_10272 [Colletotrichum truncatum]KAF6787476.1 hypothetical protein CTRU02_10272 [Colletotrichum truncatum]
MNNVRDFRPDATKLAAIANVKAKVAGKQPVVELHHQEYVYIHCANKLFIVYRDVIVAGSMYFECSLFGFFKESYSQEVFFDNDIDPEALEFYLNIAHSWFFEIKVLGTKVVPVDTFKDLVKSIQNEPLRRAHLEVPKLKLAKLANTIILADRFVHRSLLSILRQMFISLLDFTHTCWVELKAETRDWTVAYHEEITFDYLDTFNILSTGHDDEKYLRDAVTESFYWFRFDTKSFVKHYQIFMSQQFIVEWNIDRTSHAPTRMSSHAMGIFRTDQLIYASQTRQQKDRRFKRVMNLCAPESRQDWLPWLADPEEKRIRIHHLHGVATARRRGRLSTPGNHTKRSQKTKPARATNSPEDHQEGNKENLEHQKPKCRRRKRGKKVNDNPR